MGLPDGSHGPNGSCRTIVVQHSPSRSGCKPLKTHQDHTRPYAFWVGVVEDRIVLMGLPDGSYGPNGPCRTIVVQHSPPRNGSKPVKTMPVLMPPQLELWRTGVSWWVFLVAPMDPKCHVEHQLFQDSRKQRNRKSAVARQVLTDFLTPGGGFIIVNVLLNSL